MYSLGYDLGSSFVKAALVDASSGVVVSSASFPDSEMPIVSTAPGRAEQDPESWWRAIQQVTVRLASVSNIPLDAVEGIGISYQMHGLVLVDAHGSPLRPSIIWCDSRATGIGSKAFVGLGEQHCLETLLNSPGNFTASKLRWVKEHEPAIYDRAYSALLPGDYVALRMTGDFTTTIPGLSEGMFWNFHDHEVAKDLLDYYGLREELLPRRVPTMGLQGCLTPAAARELGLKPGTGLFYRAGDQPNNAFSLNVLEPGEIAATAGTSGVVYAVNGALVCDPLSRINAFAHVNHAKEVPRIGILLCINGTGIANSWIRKRAHGPMPSYDDMNLLAAKAPVGSGGVSCIPFGNGAERMLGDRDTGAHLMGLNFNLHGDPELFRAVQEGVAFSFAYGIDIMKSLHIVPRVLRAGAANMFLSPVFRSTLATVAGVQIESYNTDGAQGAARAAILGAKAGSSRRDLFKGLRMVATTEPEKDSDRHAKAYALWQARLDSLPS